MISALAAIVFSDLKGLAAGRMLRLLRLLRAARLIRMLKRYEVSGRPGYATHPSGGWRRTAHSHRDT